MADPRRLLPHSLLPLAALLAACSSGAARPADHAPGLPSDQALRLDQAPRPPDARADFFPLECRATVASGAPFGPSLALSDPGLASFLPVVAAHGPLALVAWHEFSNNLPRVAYSVIRDGCVGPKQLLSDPLSEQKRPSLAATASGYVMAYQARQGSIEVIRALTLGLDGAAAAPPSTISAPDAPGAMAQVAAAGEEVAFAWTDGSAHYFARRGSLETVAATPVGTKLLDLSTNNFPRIALDAAGNLFLAWRDGGATAHEWDVLLSVRPPKGSFSSPTNLSQSVDLMSDDISLALEADGTLDLVWVEQAPENVEAFEVEYVTRSPTGTISPPTRFATQGLDCWTPSVVPGLLTVWRTGPASQGDLFFARPSQPPLHVLPSEAVAFTRLARGAGGELHLVYNDGSNPRQVRYARGSN